MPIRMKQNGQWQQPRAMPVKVAGAIKLTQIGYVKVNGVWSIFFEAFKSIKFTGRCNGPSSTNGFHYETISNATYVVQSGDKLIYDMQQHGPTLQSGLDGAISRNGSWIENLRDFNRDTVQGGDGSRLKDQRGWLMHPGTAGVSAAGVWTQRIIDLSVVVGLTVGPWCVAFEGDVAGDYTTFFRDIKIVDANGNVKLTIFNKSLDVAGLSTYMNTSNNYTSIAKVVDTSPL